MFFRFYLGGLFRIYNNILLLRKKMFPALQGFGEINIQLIKNHLISREFCAGGLPWKIRW
jgi:hypothetical protein